MTESQPRSRRAVISVDVQRGKVVLAGVDLTEAGFAALADAAGVALSRVCPARPAAGDDSVATGAGEG